LENEEAPDVDGLVAEAELKFAWAVSKPRRERANFILAYLGKV